MRILDSQLADHARNVNHSETVRTMSAELLAARQVIAALRPAVETIEGGANASVTSRMNEFAKVRAALMLYELAVVQ